MGSEMCIRDRCSGTSSNLALEWAAVAALAALAALAAFAVAAVAAASTPALASASELPNQETQLFGQARSATSPELGHLADSAGPLLDSDSGLARAT